MTKEHTSVFRSVLIAVFIGTSLIIAALIVRSEQRVLDRSQPTAAHMRARGKCAQCHMRETSAIVEQFHLSKHAASAVNCLDCHAVEDGQEKVSHRGFEIATSVTSKNCATCHSTQYEQYLRSRHAAPAWAAVHGSEEFSEAQIASAEKYHQGTVLRPANALAKLEGSSAISVGCEGCHDVGKPNADGSIGNCTDCHGRHSASIELARRAETCGQCHMGPDHSQLEIYHASKHGVLFNALQSSMNLKADPKKLSSRDMSVPTCATCHMSGLEGLKFTHDVSERLSYWLFAPISNKRPTYSQGQAEMKEVCLKCHTSKPIEKFYLEAESVVQSTNEKVTAAKAIVDALYADKIISPEPFDDPIEFLYFDLWHYFGRTAKHGAFMGGADFVQWHGNYELLLKTIELEEMAEELREKHSASPH